MIDRQALESIAASHAQAMSTDAVTLELHLQNGEVYCVQSVAEALDGYCVVLVHPQERDQEARDEMPRNTRGQPIYDRLVVPYESVAYMLLSAAEDEGAWQRAPR
jgi:hypothetical protein